MDYEKRFQEVTAAVEEILSDTKVTLDYFEVDLVKHKEKGVYSCESYTGVNHMQSLAGMTNNMGLLFEFYALMGTYHILAKHEHEIPEDVCNEYLLQEHALYKHLERYKYERDHFNQACKTDDPRKGTINPNNWYEDLLKRRGDKSDGPN